MRSVCLLAVAILLGCGYNPHLPETDAGIDSLASALASDARSAVIEASALPADARALEAAVVLPDVVAQDVLPSVDVRPAVDYWPECPRGLDYSSAVSCGKELNLPYSCTCVRGKVAEQTPCMSPMGWVVASAFVCAAVTGVAL